jgi:hypothetical protein
MGDLAKMQISTWAPSPLTSTWTKAPLPRIQPDPRRTDSDGDGLADAEDPFPLYPWPPLIWPMTAQVDGKAEEWQSVPLSGRGVTPGLEITFKQGHDDAAYYACFRLKGNYQRIAVALDGEGQGYYTTNSTYAFDIVPGENGGPPAVRPTSGNRCPGMAWKSGLENGSATVEIAIPNRGESLWFWTGGGREVGAAVSAWTKDGRPLSLYEPYTFLYARMLERNGRAALPPGAPAEVAEGPGVQSVDFTRLPLDKRWEFVRGNWEYRDGAVRFVRGEDGENYLYLEEFDTVDFDIWAEFEAANDMHIAAWSKETARTDNMNDYVAFLGGYGNARSVIRLFGQEAAAEDVGISPGRHTMQLTRREKQLWLLYDGKPLLWAPDTQPQRRVHRLGFLGGWGGAQVLYRIRLRGQPRS